MLFAIALPVIRVRLPPFPLAGSHVFGVCRIVANSFPMVVAPSLPLASWLAAHALFRSIDGRLENLATVAATPARPHARFLFSSGVRSSKRPRKTNQAGRRNIE